MEKFELASCLAALRADLEEVVDEGADSNIKFIVEDVSLEFQVVAGKEAGGGAGVKWWIFSAEANGKISDATTQKLALKLKVTGKDGKSPVPMRGG